MAKMSLQEQQMFDANLKLSNEVRGLREEVKILVNYILGTSKDKFLVKNIIKKYKQLAPSQEGRHE